MLPGYPARLEKEPQGHLAGRLPYDCDWAIVARYFPEAFPPEAQDHAEAVLRRYHTRAMALTPTPNPPGWTVID